MGNVCTFESRLDTRCDLACERLAENDKSLLILDVSGCPMGHSGARAISKALKQNTTVERLVLSGNEIGYKGVEAISLAISHNYTLVHLDLSNNGIGDKGARALALTLSGPNRTLQDLCLVNNSIGSAGARDIAAALGTNSGLRCLNLRWNGIDAIGSSAIVSAIGHRSSGVQSLLLGLNRDIGVNGAQNIAMSLKTNRTLTALDLEDTGLLDLGVRAIALSIAKNDTMQTLWLMTNSIGDDGASALADTLWTNRGLQNLCLGNNDISTVGIHALATSLEYNSTLIKFDLSTNPRIGLAGKQRLVSILKTNVGLQEILMNRNQIGQDDEGRRETSVVQAISEALSKNRTLRLLSLRENFVRDEGAILIAKALEGNVMLKEIDLVNCSIGVDGARALAKSLDRNRALLRLDLELNSIQCRSLLHDRLRLNQIVLEIPKWVETITQRVAVLSKLTNLPSFAVKSGMLAYGDLLVPSAGWRTQDGRDFACKYLMPLAEAELMRKLITHETDVQN
jgi:Ran GTPase-activating protein (RanGAP) involved in mRNA processing and transport